MLKQCLESKRSEAGLGEDLAIAQADRGPPIDRDIEVTVHVAVALLRGVVEETTVELDQQRSVVRVAIDDSQGGRGARLALGSRKAVSALDPDEIAVLEMTPAWCLDVSPGRMPTRMDVQGGWRDTPVPDLWKWERRSVGVTR